MAEISLEITSVIEVLKQVAITSNFTGFIRIKEPEKPGFYIWIDDNKFLGVSGCQPDIIDKLRVNKILTNKKLLEAITEERKQLKTPIGNKLNSVYDVKQGYIDRLFIEQIDEVAQRIDLNRGTIDIKQCQKSAFHWYELMGTSISIEKLILTCLENNFSQRYRDRLPTNEETIDTTDKNNKIPEIEGTKYQQIINLADRDLSLKKIAAKIGISLTDTKQKVFILMQLGLVETSLTQEGFAKYSQKFFSSYSKTGRLKVSNKQSLTAPILAIGVINILLLLATSWGFFSNAELSFLDRHFRLRGTKENKDITLVTIDEADIAEIKKYPIPDKLLARALENLNRYSPRVIGIDIYRDLPAPPGHVKLLEVFEEYPNIVGVEKLQEISGPPILNEYGMVGFSDLDLDADGTLRRALTLTTLDETKVGLGTFLAVYFLSNNGENALAREDDRYLLSGKPLPYLTENSGGYWNTEIKGLQTMLDYQHRQKDFNTLDFIDVLNENFNPKNIEDKIVIIGVTAASKKDFIYTPFSRNNKGKSIPQAGVVAHANVTAQLLDFALRDRSILQPNSKIWETGYIIVWSLAGVLIGVVAVELKLKNNANSTVIIVGQTALLGAAAYASGYLAFILGYWIPIVVPAINSFIVANLTNLQYEDRIKNLIYVDKTIDTYNRYYLDKHLKQDLEYNKTNKTKLGLILCQLKIKALTKEEQNKIFKQVARAIKLELFKDNNEEFMARYNNNTLAIVTNNTNSNKLENLQQKLVSILEQNKHGKLYTFAIGKAVSDEFINSAVALYIKAAGDLSQNFSKH